MKTMETLQLFRGDTVLLKVSVGRRGVVERARERSEKDAPRAPFSRALSNLMTSPFHLHFLLG